MSSTLERRVARLETTRATDSGMIVHWELPEDATALSCKGRTFPRQEGETVPNLVLRVEESLTPCPGEILWLDQA